MSNSGLGRGSIRNNRAPHQEFPDPASGSFLGMAVRVREVSYTGQCMIPRRDLNIKICRPVPLADA